MKTVVSRTTVCFVIAACLLTGSAVDVLAQAATSAASTASSGPASSTGTNQEIIELSPFEVRADEDVGYQGINTTSGSRLNTSLRDTASQISPFTKEFIDDIAATSLNDIVQYSSNFEAELDDAAGQFQGGSFMNRADNVNSPFRLRGQGASISVDLIETGVPVDLSDVERAEVSSGPNSILFGTGSTGGLVALGTKRANLQRESYTARFQYGSWANQRAEFDTNQVLRKGVLAARVWGLWGDRQGWRHWDFEDSRRINGSVTFRPIKSLTLTVSGGVGELERHVTQPWTPIDGFTLWRNLGSKMGPVSGNATTLLNTYGLATTTATSNLFTFVDNDSSIVNFGRGTLRARGSLLQATGFEKQLVTPDVMPYSYSFTGPGSRYESDFHNFLARAEQRLGRDLVVEVAYQQTKSDNFATNYQIGTDFGELTADPNPNRVKLDGTTETNPYAGRLLLQTNWRPEYAVIENRVVRGTVAYELRLADLLKSWRFGSWLGTHRFAGMLERGTLDRSRLDYAEILVDQNNVPVAGAAVPENSLLYRRHYLTEGDFTTYYMSDPRLAIPAVGVGANQYKMRAVATSQAETSQTRRVTDTWMLAVQDRWLKERLITTFGYRNDSVLTQQAVAQRLTATDDPVVSGERLVNEWYILPGSPTNDRRIHPYTRTAGAVLHLHPRVSAFYNQSNNVGAPRLDRTVLPGVLPPPTRGEGKDYGLMLDLLNDNRFFIRINQFESNQVGDATIVPSGVANTSHFYTNAATSMLNGLLAAGRITQAEYDAHYVAFSSMTIDTQSKGTEVEFIANPTRNWTFRVSGSHTKRETANMFAEGEPFTSDLLAFVRSKDSPGFTFSDLSGNPTTIEQQVALIVDELAVRRTQTEKVANGTRPYKINVTTRYRFSEGKLKGLFVGGSHIYQSPNRMNTTVPGVVLWGKNVESTNLFAGYDLRLPWRKATMRVQLNVNNVFNVRLWAPGQYTIASQNAIVAGTATEGVLRRVYLRAPREFRLSTTLNF